MPSAEVEVLEVQRRRRWSAAEKQRLVEETFRPGMNVSIVAREHRVSPSLLFRCRKLSTAGALQAVGAEESVVPACELKAAQQQIRELQRLLGKKTLENEILKEAQEIAREKSGLCARRDRRRALCGGCCVPGSSCVPEQCCRASSTGSARRATPRAAAL
jgi:transposase